MTMLTVNDADLVHPNAGTQRHLLLEVFSRGESLTVAEALYKHGIYALSQRVGELKREGWQIRSRTVTTPGGARISRYWMESSTERGAA